MKFYVRYGLSGSFGGCKDQDWEEVEALDFEDAEELAYEQACQQYESYEGMYGLRTVEDIMEEEGLDEDEAYDLYLEERDNWLSYEVKKD